MSSHLTSTAKAPKSDELPIPAPFSFRAKESWHVNHSEYVSHVLSNYGFTTYDSQSRTLSFNDLRNRQIKTIGSLTGELVELPVECPFTVFIAKVIPCTAQVYDTQTGYLLESVSPIVPFTKKQESALFIKDYLCFIKRTEKDLEIQAFQKDPERGNLQKIYRAPILKTKGAIFEKALISRTHAVFFSKPLPTLRREPASSKERAPNMHIVTLSNRKQSSRYFEYDSINDTICLSDSIFCHHSPQKGELIFIDLKKKGILSCVQERSLEFSTLLSLKGSTTFFLGPFTYFFASPQTTRLEKAFPQEGKCAYILDPNHLLIYHPDSKKFYYKEISSSAQTTLNFQPPSEVDLFHNKMDLVLLSENRLAFCDSTSIFFYEPIGDLAETA